MKIRFPVAFQLLVITAVANTLPAGKDTEDIMVGVTGMFVAIKGGELQVTQLTPDTPAAATLEKGDVLSFGKLKYGIRSYLSVLGGFLTKRVMNSRSMYSNITKSFRIVKGQSLKINSIKIKQANKPGSVLFTIT